MARPTQRTRIAGLICWLLVVFVVAAIGAIASIHADQFYTSLARPSWAPPPAIFGPVWTVLYTLMGMAAWLVWSPGGFRSARSALLIFLAQLAPNAIWSWLFFAWHLGALAFADIVLLLGLVFSTIVLFWRMKPLAGALLLPYLLWIAFAAALNYSVWRLNPQLPVDATVACRFLAIRSSGMPRLVAVCWEDRGRRPLGQHFRAFRRPFRD